MRKMLTLLGFICVLGLLVPTDAAAMVGFDDMIIDGDDTVNWVICLGGDIRVDGEVTGTVIALGGDIRVNGDIGDDIVSFGGDVIVSGGGTVEGSVSSYGGDVIVETDGTVEDDISSAGGEITVAPGGMVYGERRTSGGIPRFHMPWSRFGSGPSNILRSLFGGPLFGSPLRAAGASLFFMLKVLFWIALATITTVLMPDTVHRLSRVAEMELPRAVLAGFLCMVMMPFALFALLITLVGIPLIPFAILILLILYAIGSVGVALWVGRVIPESVSRSLTANAILGMLIINAVKLIPIGGFLVTIILSSSAFGVVFITMLSKRIKREETATYI